MLFELGTKKIKIFSQSVISLFLSTWWQACHHFACSKAADLRERKLRLRNKQTETSLSQTTN